ncbi:hypothetical protein HDU85_005655 [Gaertneriomyces sp. JEL0708]|nr:hypothetical protein HDU85_005655 [Gaertneriomyces sp. JEL0708]
MSQTTLVPVQIVSNTWFTITHPSDTSDTKAATCPTVSLTSTNFPHYTYLLGHPLFPTFRPHIYDLLAKLEAPDSAVVKIGVGKSVPSDATALLRVRSKARKDKEAEFGARAVRKCLVDGAWKMREGSVIDEEPNKNQAKGKGWKTSWWVYARW